VLSAEGLVEGIRRMKRMAGKRRSYIDKPELKGVFQTKVAEWVASCLMTKL
jgi:hypothetical protein